MNEQIRPKFLLFLENDKDELVGSFHDVEGIEFPLNETDVCDGIRLFNGFFNPSFDEKSDLERCDIRICICDEEGELMTSFSGVAEELVISQVNNSLEVALKGEGLPFMSHGALSIWLNRRKGLPINKGSWIDLSLIEREAWLEVALLDSRKSAARMERSKAEIDGELVQDQVSFLCSFGEAVFGPGGYIGRNLSALEDCLTGGFGVESPLQLHWINSKLSEDSFRRRGESDIYKDILGVLEGANVQVVYG